VRTSGPVSARRRALWWSGLHSLLQIALGVVLAPVLMSDLRSAVTVFVVFAFVFIAPSAIVIYHTVLRKLREDMTSQAPPAQRPGNDA
jgi:uncharacterized membrane protein HdeD (DUF308 family)